MISIDKNSKQNLIIRVIYIILVVMINVGFFFVLGERGTLLFKDSPTFIEWSYSTKHITYQIYPLFLRFIRNIQGENTYIRYIYVYQGLLSVIANVGLVEYIRRKYELNHLSGLAAYVAIMATYGFTLPEAVSSHYIASESITIPLFLVSVLFVIRYYLDNSYISMLLGLAGGYLLYKTRPQLIIFLLVFIVFFICYEIYKIWGVYNRKRFYIAFVLAAFMSMIIGIVAMFRVIEGWGDSAANTQMIEAITGKALCLMREEDSALYKGEDKEVFELLYNDVANRGARIADYPDSIINYEPIHVKINDNITEHESIIWNYFIAKRGDDGGEDAYAVRNLITATEVRNHRGDFVRVIIRLMPSSLVASIFIQPESIRIACYLVAGIIYIFALGVILYGFTRHINGEYVTPLFFVIMLIISNASASNTVLYGQQRYVIYCMGIFYVFFAIAIIGCYRKRNILSSGEKP